MTEVFNNIKELSEYTTISIDANVALSRFLKNISQINYPNLKG